MAEPPGTPAPQPKPGLQPQPQAQPQDSPNLTEASDAPAPQPKPEPLAMTPSSEPKISKPQQETLAPAEPKPLAERLKGWLDGLLVADVFLVIGAALWFGLAVLLHSRSIEAPLRLFERLWQPLFLPAISLLMAAAIVSGVLGWWRRRGQS